MYWIIAECGLVNLANVCTIEILAPETEVNGTWAVVAYRSGRSIGWVMHTAKTRQICVDWMNDLFLKLKEIRDGSFTRSD